MENYEFKFVMHGKPSVCEDLFDIIGDIEFLKEGEEIGLLSLCCPIELYLELARWENSDLEEIFRYKHILGDEIRIESEKNEKFHVTIGYWRHYPITNFEITESFYLMTDNLKEFSVFLKSEIENLAKAFFDKKTTKKLLKEFKKFEEQTT